MMAKVSRRLRDIRKNIEKGVFYDVSDALVLLKGSANARFVESVDVAVNLGVDPRKSDQIVRGSVVLPKGLGKSVRVAVITPTTNHQLAKDAGADLVGFEDLVEEIRSGVIDFDVLIASPDAMKLVGQLGQILGPKGLMPNPKLGTVSTDIYNAVKDVKAGQVQYRTDRAGVVHAIVGKVDFPDEDLKENLVFFLGALIKAKPSGAKGQYLRKVSLSTTMGLGLKIDLKSLGF